jgi:S1-C subfamily serine protease
MEAFRLLYTAALAAILGFSGSSCASGARSVPIRPCLEARASVAPPDPCASLDAPSCAGRMEFVRRMYASTVLLHVTKYAPETGVTYSGGTGTVIDATGRVLTAHHVVDNARFIVVGIRRLGDDGRSVVRVRDVPMEVVSSDAASDVALLRPTVSTETFPPPLEMRRTPIREGETLWHFGNVSFWGYGRVNGLGVSFDGTDGLTRVDFACRHGDSGGPFVDTDGRLVGVLVKKDGDGEGVGQTYFTPIGAALDALGYSPP